MRRRSLGRGEDSTKPRGGPLQAGDVEAGKRSNVGVSLFLIFYQIYTLYTNIYLSMVAASWKTRWRNYVAMS